MSSNVFVQRFSHIKAMPREKEALEILQKVASLVKPIMRKHAWVLPVLAEFYPENPGLLGININGGQKICLRLRPHFDKGAFLRLEDIVGTMLHELTHNVHGPHDQKFYQFLSKLEDEFDALQRSGYAGEGFFSNGTRLGQGVSHNVSPQVGRERALAAAEKRRQVAVVMNAGNRRLGGGAREGKSMRQLAAEAAERRISDEKSCASGWAEAEAEVERATQRSVVDDAEEDSDPEIILLDGPPEGVDFERSVASAIATCTAASCGNNETSTACDEAYDENSTESNFQNDAFGAASSADLGLPGVHLDERDQRHAEGRTLRKNFEKVMQSSMAVRAYKNSVTLRPMQQHARQADMDAEAEGASTTPKKGVEKLWWEGVEDGKEAVVGPHLLARAASLAQKTAESEAASAQFAASHSHVVEPTVPGRSPTVFVDVGSKFVDAKDVAKREKAADARRRLKEKKKVA
ncbi:hypothetical protein FRB90_010907 [Tulasnella sp. 427]|nr:hypothetical protein FRB90_010907 [Tulasnella sp. 427]